jgi:hypothetical protein
MLGEELADHPLFVLVLQAGEEFSPQPENRFGAVEGEAGVHLSDGVVADRRDRGGTWRLRSHDSGPSTLWHGLSGMRTGKGKKAERPGEQR